MTSRLQAEWHRLFLPHAGTGQRGPDEHTSLIDAKGRVRAMVLSLAKPADWSALSVVWQAVQADMGLPAPAIAVSGDDAYQLWFSLAEAVSVPEARGLLEALRTRYLGHIAPHRITLLPALDAQAQAQAWPADSVPPQPVQTDQWSAFLAPDLAPMFAETPWLDLAPSPEGQADLLSGLQSIKPGAWRAALTLSSPVQDLAQSTASSACSATRPPCQDPRQFLLDVMNDNTVALALRIEAAKALLPHSPLVP